MRFVVLVFCMRSVGEKGTQTLSLCVRVEVSARSLESAIHRLGELYVRNDLVPFRRLPIY